MDTEMKFAWIPPGTCLIGGIQQGDYPQRQVTLGKGFWMGVTPVTQAQWRSVMGYNPSQFKGDDRPVECVSWDDSMEFCRKLGDLTHKPIRLPTEDEWEYACRAGSVSEYCNGGGDEALKAVGWCEANSGGQTHPVGKLAPNAWGLHDVHGNVWEWCQEGTSMLMTGQQQQQQQQMQNRTLRGGTIHNHWNHLRTSCRAAYRLTERGDARGCIYGLRVCFHLGG